MAEEESYQRSEGSRNRNDRRNGGRPYGGRRDFDGEGSERRDRGHGSYRGGSGYRDHRPRDGDSDHRGYRPHSGGDRRGGDRSGYRGGSGHRDNRSREGDSEHRPRENGDSSERRDFRPRDNDGGERREYRPRYGNDRGRRDSGRRDGGRGGYGRRDGGRGYHDRNSGERREFRPREHNDITVNSEDHSVTAENGESNTGEERREYRPRDNDRGDRREYRPRYGNDRGRRDSGRRDGGRGGYGRRDGDRRSHDRDFRDRREYRPRDDEGSEEESVHDVPQGRIKLVISKDPQKLLFKGVDCKINGRTELAMTLFLHGSVLMSKGCENNILNMLREMDADSIKEMRDYIAQDCSKEALAEFDYLCYKLDDTHDRTYFDSLYDEKNNHVIYRKICLGEIDGGDAIIDIFASRHEDEPEKVDDGLKQLKRIGSSRAERHMEIFAEEKKLRDSIHNLFVAAYKGNNGAKRELIRLSDRFPEAAFFIEFLDAKDEGREVEWLKNKYQNFSEFIVKEEQQFNLRDDPFGLFLRAKKLQSQKAEWIPAMLKASRYGSEEAMNELESLSYRVDIKKALASIHLANRDLEKLISVYEGGLEDTYYLDQYCGDNMLVAVEVGAALGQFDINRQIEWLLKHTNCDGRVCKDELIRLSKDDKYRVRMMVYALSDMHEHLMAAQLYFKLSDEERPAVKWLRKVCETEEAKEYIQRYYENMGDFETFDSIFVDDGYVKKPAFARKKGKRRY